MEAERPLPDRRGVQRLVAQVSNRSHQAGTSTETWMWPSWRGGGAALSYHRFGSSGHVVDLSLTFQSVLHEQIPQRLLRGFHFGHAWQIARRCFTIRRGA